MADSGYGMPEAQQFLLSATSVEILFFCWVRLGHVGIEEARVDLLSTFESVSIMSKGKESMKFLQGFYQYNREQRHNLLF